MEFILQQLELAKRRDENNSQNMNHLFNIAQQQQPARQQQQPSGGADISFLLQIAGGGGGGGAAAINPPPPVQQGVTNLLQLAGGGGAAGGAAAATNAAIAETERKRQEEEERERQRKSEKNRERKERRKRQKEKEAQEWRKMQQEAEEHKKEQEEYQHRLRLQQEQLALAKQKEEEERRRQQHLQQVALEEERRKQELLALAKKQKEEEERKKREEEERQRKTEEERRKQEQLALAKKKQEEEERKKRELEEKKKKEEEERRRKAEEERKKQELLALAKKKQEEEEKKKKEEEQRRKAEEERRKQEQLALAKKKQEEEKRRQEEEAEKEKRRVEELLALAKKKEEEEGEAERKRRQELLDAIDSVYDQYMVARSPGQNQTATTAAAATNARRPAAAAAEEEDEEEEDEEDDEDDNDDYDDDDYDDDDDDEPDEETIQARVDVLARVARDLVRRVMEREKRSGCPLAELLRDSSLNPKNIFRLISSTQRRLYADREKPVFVNDRDMKLDAYQVRIACKTQIQQMYEGNCSQSNYFHTHDYVLNNMDASDPYDWNAEGVFSSTARSCGGQLAYEPEKKRPQLQVWKGAGGDVDVRNLKINEHLGGIGERILQHETICISAPTGTGKSLGIPLYVADSLKLRIIVAVPTVVAVLALYHRQKHLVQKMGLTIGYAARGEVKYDSRSTNIVYCTTGHLKEVLLKEDRIMHWDIVMIDEAHDRSVNTYLAFALFKYRKEKVMNPDAEDDANRRNPFAEDEGRDDDEEVEDDDASSSNSVRSLSEFTLDPSSAAAGGANNNDNRRQSRRGRKLTFPKLIISSASLDVPHMEEMFEDVDVINLGQEMDTPFSVDIQYYLSDESTRVLGGSWDGGHFRWNTIAEAIARIVDEENMEAHIDDVFLIFCPGADEVEQLIHLMWRLYPRLKSSTTIFPAYSALLPEEIEEAVHSRPEKGTRKIIVATNICESSCTIPDVGLVIDSMHERVIVTNPSGIEELRTRLISKSSATQRAGRTGRTKKGVCIRMCSESQYEYELPAFSDMEIMRVPIHGPLLSLARAWLNPLDILLDVNPVVLNRCVQDLLELKLVESFDENKVPIDPFPVLDSRRRRDGFSIFDSDEEPAEQNLVFLSTFFDRWCATDAGLFCERIPVSIRFAAAIENAVYHNLGVAETVTAVAVIEGSEGSFFYVPRANKDNYEYDYAARKKELVERCWKCHRGQNDVETLLNIFDEAWEMRRNAKEVRDWTNDVSINHKKIWTTIGLFKRLCRLVQIDPETIETTRTMDISLALENLQMFFLKFALSPAPRVRGRFLMKGSSSPWTIGDSRSFCRDTEEFLRVGEHLIPLVRLVLEGRGGGERCTAGVVFKAIRFVDETRNAGYEDEEEEDEEEEEEEDDDEEDDEEEEEGEEEEYYDDDDEEDDDMMAINRQDNRRRRA